MCSLEIIIPILAAITACATAVAGASEVLPFIKKLSGNGIAHTIYHLFHKEKCVPSDESVDESVVDV